MQHVTIEAFKLQELTGQAKERALNRLRDFATPYDWPESTLDDAKTDIEAHGFITPDIQYSGFSSQGDGLSFTCKYVDLNKAFEYIDIPHSQHKRTWLNLFSCRLKRISHHYSHERTVHLNLEADIYNRNRLPHLFSIRDTLQEKLDSLRVDLCHKWYRTLEKEYEYLMSEEQLTETADANEYLFDVHGRLI